MDESKNRIDLQALDTITDRILQYTPPRSLTSQMRPTTVDAKESTSGASIPNSTDKITGEAQRNKNRD